MTPDQIQISANALFEAEKSRQQMGLISLAHPEMNMDDAYAVQSAYVDKKREIGGKQRGWKIGLTSKAMQSALGIDIPDSGILFEDMFFEDSAQIPRDRFIQPRIEAEIAVLDRVGEQNIEANRRRTGTRHGAAEQDGDIAGLFTGLDRELAHCQRLRGTEADAGFGGNGQLVGAKGAQTVDRIGQRADHCFLTDELGEGLRPILAR
mgnify:CR=1 FL=1